MGMAIEVRDISITTIAVSDQIPPQCSRKVCRKLLEQVLVRISGNARIMTLPVIRDVLPKINNYVEKYSYLAKADEKGGQQSYYCGLCSINGP